jgi:Flp pilus assembly protein TadG
MTGAERTLPEPPKPGRRAARALWRGDGGNTIVEFAYIFPVLMTMLFGVFEFGRLLYTQSVLSYAVQEAARCGSVDINSCGSASATQSYAVSRASPLTFATSVFTVSKPNCGSQVSASYPFNFIVPRLLPYTITLSARACVP